MSMGWGQMGVDRVEHKLLFPFYSWWNPLRDLSKATHLVSGGARIRIQIFDTIANIKQTKKMFLGYPIQAPSAWKKIKSKQILVISITIIGILKC